MVNVFYEKSANCIIHQIRGNGSVRVYAPNDWLEAEDIKQYDTIKVTFKVMGRYKPSKRYSSSEDNMPLIRTIDFVKLWILHFFALNSSIIDLNSLIRCMIK